jgi:hypothetical protein
VLKEFAPKFKEPIVTAAKAKVAVVCDKGRRAQYGELRDLALVAQILVAENATPYHVLFGEAILAERRWQSQLRRYEKVIVLADGLPEEVLTKVRLTVQPNRLAVVRQDEPEWQEALREFLRK